MAVKIRLRRMGAKKAPFYRVVVADSRFPRDGRFIEEIGYFNPNTDPADVKIDGDKAKDWIAKGAQPTDTVKALLKKNFNSVSGLSAVSNPLLSLFSVNLDFSGFLHGVVVTDFLDETTVTGIS